LNYSILKNKFHDWKNCKTISTVTSDNFSSHFERRLTRLSASIDLNR